MTLQSSSHTLIHERCASCAAAYIKLYTALSLLVSKLLVVILLNTMCVKSV